MILDNFVTHKNLVSFADQYINLKRDDVWTYRQQVNNLREKLENYINDHPDFSLVKMLNAGSLAKGTALKSINDIDVAVYIKKTDVNASEPHLINHFCTLLQTAYGGWKRESDFVKQINCVTVMFHGTGLNVDVVPVLYDGEENGKGYLIAKDTGERILTSIPMHLKFTQHRKEKYGSDYKQIIRFIKYWKTQLKKELRFKSFMIELLVAYLWDKEHSVKDNHLDSLAKFFSYVVRSQLKEKIMFNDYYNVSIVKSSNDPIQIFDPVNPDNNVASRYTEQERQLIVQAAEDTLDTIACARRSASKSEAEFLWQEIFGSAFKVMR
jgi:tRNA nucleotidyltransferase (CCA-adding enzyme)